MYRLLLERFEVSILCCLAVVLLLFAVFSVLLYIFLIGYLLSVKECTPAARVISPFVEAPFLVVQVSTLGKVFRNRFPANAK